MTVLYTQRYIPKCCNRQNILFVSFGRWPETKQYLFQLPTYTSFQYRLQLCRYYRTAYKYRSFTTSTSSNTYILWRQIIHVNHGYHELIGDRSRLFRRFFNSTEGIHTNNTNQIKHVIQESKQNPQFLRKKTVIVFGICVFITTILSTSIFIRKWRIQQQMELSLLNKLIQPIHETQHYNNYCHRSISNLISTMHRSGLMGTLLYMPQQQHEKQDNVNHNSKNNHKDMSNDLDQRPSNNKKRRRRAQSVLEELHSIRQWHQQNGFYGGIVVRDISNVDTNNDNKSDNNNNTIDDSETTTSSTTMTTPNHDTSYCSKLRNYIYTKCINPFKEYIYQQSIARRECYYIYYEISSQTGQQYQHIFIRGTTLWIDILTCIQTYMIYDNEIQCYVHYGFVQHTDRIINDIIPLLSKDAIIEISGHSLGGAVASILAMKLHLRGYKIHQLTTIGEPAYLWFNPIKQLFDSNQQQLRKQRMHIQSLLPNDHIRIEHDCDIVPYLPPFGSHIGNKIWVTRKQYMTTTKDTENNNDLKPNCDLCSSNIYWVEESLHNNSTWNWTESIWINFCIPEIIQFHSISHRISNYIQQLVSCTNSNINCNNDASCSNSSSSKRQRNASTSDV